MRLDICVTEKYEISRNKAQALIDEGSICVNGIIKKKSSYNISSEDSISMHDNESFHYVSRSALKLKYVLEELSINVEGCICLDVGASTGGFTQVLLEKGARRVIAVDGGTNQLHKSIREKESVQSLENMDIRYYETQNIFDVIVCDISFISLTKVIEKLKSLATKKTEIILLFKPQFEVGIMHLKRSGVPKNDEIVQSSLSSFLLLIQGLGFEIKATAPSQIHGEGGNKEIFIYIKKGE